MKMINYWQKSIALFVLGLFIAPACWAEPSTITRFLINEPASLMDLAIYKLNVDINQPFFLNELSLDGIPPLLIKADYDWDEDRITIRANYIYEGDKNQFASQEMRNSISKLIADIKILNHQVSEGQSISILSEYFANIFSHSGYYTDSRPDNWKEMLIDRIDICVFVHLSHTKKSIIARSSLGKNTILWNLPE